MAVPVAQYLRTSTEQQQYSLENQAETICEYARRHGFHIVATYSDAGRSGILLRDRPGLIRLLNDVTGGDAAFSAVLVYDVSRWGRFQDCDEAAHYEFICKNSGVPVHYCAESFPNDNTVPSYIFKSVKRSMAAEYSRELGAKVFSGAQRLAELGFKQGGKSGYGLRRLMISANGERKKILENHEIKSFRTDRVVLVPGPDEEVECVREMFRLVVSENRTPSYVTEMLNRRAEGVPPRKWRLGHVCRILTDPKYAGYNVWNRSSRRLGQPSVQIPKSKWILTSNAFEPIVDRATFEQAQHILAEQKRPYSHAELLDQLRSCLKRHGRLSYHIVKSSSDLPSINTFIKRFGTLRRAFELAGHRYPWMEVGNGLHDQVKHLRDDLLCQIEAIFPREVRIVHADAEEPEYVQVDESFRVTVIICPAVRRGGHLSWLAMSSSTDRKSTTLLARLTPENKGFRDFYVLPCPGRHWIRHRGELKKGKRLSSLAEFCSVVRAVAAPLQRGSGYFC